MYTVQRFFIGLTGVLLLFSQPGIVWADVTAGSSTTVAVPPKTSDYQLSLTQSVGGGPISQGTEITYTITYGALANSAFTLDDTLTANFSQNTLNGVTTIADYMSGSATNGYNGTQPVVDYVNKTITWHISQMTAGTTDQVVTFKLETNSNYTGTNYIPITVTAGFSNKYITLPQQSVTTTYGFHISEPSPTTPTPTPIPPSSVTPTPIPNSLQITSISFPEITPNETTIHIGTSQKTSLTALYGLSQNALYQVISDTNLTSSHNLHLTKLSPQSQYFIKLIATDQNGNSATSDILTFKTAKLPSPVRIDQQSVILVSGNYPLINTNVLLPFPQVLIPNNQTYTVGLRVSQPISLKSIVALVENSQVLGANTFTSSSGVIWSAPMIEQQPGVYIAQLSAPPVPSTYDVFAQIRDNAGNITQTKIAQAIVYGPLHIVDTNTQKGIEHARIFLSIYDKSKNSYEPILSSQIQQNPIFTDKNGFATINNGSGKYKISASQYGYKTKEVIFSIDSSHFFPPTIALTHNGFNVVDVGQYYMNTASDFSQSLIASLQNVGTAPRFFKLISILVVASLVIVTFMLFLIRTRLSIFVIPIFIKHHTQKTGFVHGQILDAINHQPISQAVIAISDRDSHEVLITTTTNKNGIFYLDSKWANSDNIINILASGYRTNKFAINKDLFPATFSLHHNLVGGPLHHPLVASILHITSLFFEVTLVMSFLLELFFISTVGMWGFVFVGISLFTLLLWVLYQQEKKL